MIAGTDIYTFLAFVFCNVFIYLEYFYGTL